MERAREGTLKPVAHSNGDASKPTASKRKGRWDQSTDETPVVKQKIIAATPSQQATPSWENEVICLNNYKIKMSNWPKVHMTKL